MPSRPDFDLYETLELSKTATQDEITKSYKRLALIHHPDKNLDNLEATSRFQEISTAYEILRDTDSRRKYDTPPRSSSFSPSDSSSGGFGENEYGIDIEEMVFRVFFSGQSGSNPFGGRGFGGGGGEGFSYSQFGNGGGHSHAQRERNSAAHARERQEAALQAHQRAERERKEQERRKEREAEKMAEEKKREAETKARLALEAKEHTEQQRRWAEANAVKQTERQAICSHTKFWPKEQQKKKFKCGDCGQKHGMTAFKCPHCALLVCQLCIQKTGVKVNAS